MTLPSPLPVALKAPAKLNLGLKIVGVRSDGYHLLESLFTPVSLFDDIEIKESSHDKAEFFDQKGQSLDFENDTVLRALNLFRDNGGDFPFLHVVVRKNIPHGAGMGGGSSDGGTLLRYLKKTYSPQFPEETLQKLALQMGADTPFFLQSKPALVTGIGEVVNPVEITPMVFLIICPPFKVATREAFSWFDEECRLTHRNTNATPRTINEVSEPDPHRFLVPEIVGRLVNDLTKTVTARHPEIAVMEKALSSRGALGTLMSGTGCSVYGIFTTLTEAQSVRESLRASLPSDYAYFICETFSAADNVAL